jgi:hypothetical protein
MSSDYHYVLGAEDAEMICIERALRTLGLPFVYAAENGVRVTQDNAYSANGFIAAPGIDYFNPVAATGQKVSIECTVTVDPVYTPDTEVDHHYPGDVGYGGVAADFFESSSVGQVYNQLVDPGEGFTVPQVDAAFGSDIEFIAAADHCLAAAYQEDCPDITFAGMLDYRARVEAIAAKKDVKVIKERFMDDAAIIRSLPETTVGALTYRIATDRPVVYHTEAAAMVNTVVEFETKEPKDRTRVSLVGITNPTTISPWITAKLDTLHSIVSEQYRGYAYGYKKY